MGTVSYLVRIRLQPGHSTKGRGPRMWRIVAVVARRRRDTGKILENLGTLEARATGGNIYDNARRVRMNFERCKYWLAMGAHPTQPIEKLFGLAGILPMKPEKNANVYKPFIHIPEKYQQIYAKYLKPTGAEQAS